MSLEFDAVYENGILKPDHPLPLAERQRVRVVVNDPVAELHRLCSLMQWKGDPEVVRAIAEDIELDVLESP
jgi:predicted DNA-binding antitoxin AbrB/MazE fold protein